MPICRSRRTWRAPRSLTWTFRLEEGEQQIVNRINFAGNENTRDEVIRRELQLVENGVFNTAALKTSIRRLNQLGYFDPLEEDAVDIENTEEDENRVNLKFNLSEANMNQLTFGAGVSQFDGFFGQMSFQTANFLGRGETLSVSVQNGSRLRNINLGYTKPYLFGKNLSGGVNLFSRRIEWIGAYTQQSEGVSVTVGKPLALFTRMFVSYSFEKTGVSDVNPFLFGDTSDSGSFGARSLKSVLRRSAPARFRWSPNDQQDHAVGRVQHGRPPDFPPVRAAVPGFAGDGRDRWGYAVPEADARRDLVFPASRENRHRLSDAVSAHRVGYPRAASGVRAVMVGWRILDPGLRHSPGRPHAG